MKKEKEYKIICELELLTGGKIGTAVVISNVEFFKDKHAGEAILKKIIEDSFRSVFDSLLLRGCDSLKQIKQTKKTKSK